MTMQWSYGQESIDNAFRNLRFYSIGELVDILKAQQSSDIEAVKHQVQCLLVEGKLHHTFMNPLDRDAFMRAYRTNKITRERTEQFIRLNAEKIRSCSNDFSEIYLDEQGEFNVSLDVIPDNAVKIDTKGLNIHSNTPYLWVDLDDLIYKNIDFYDDDECLGEFGFSLNSKVIEVKAIQDFYFDDCKTLIETVRALDARQLIDEKKSNSMSLAFYVWRKEYPTSLKNDSEAILDEFGSKHLITVNNRNDVFEFLKEFTGIEDKVCKALGRNSSFFDYEAYGEDYILSSLSEFEEQGTFCFFWT